MTAGQFKKNELVIDAVVRNLEIIGEASKNISSSTRGRYPDIPWDQMNGMRNIPFTNISALMLQQCGIQQKLICLFSKNN